MKKGNGFFVLFLIDIFLNILFRKYYGGEGRYGGPGK